MRIFLALLLSASSLSAQADYSTLLLLSSETASLPTLDLEYDINDISSSDGTQIGSITDQSANGFHLIGAGTARPYWTNEASILNNQAFLVFDSADDFVQTNFSTTFAQSNTVFAVIKRSTASTSSFICDGGDTGANRNVMQYGSGGTLDLFAGGAAATGGTFPQNVWVIAEVGFDGNNSFVRTNGVAMASGMTGVGASGLQGLTLNARYSNSSFGGMHLAYFALKNGAITPGERAAMLAALNARFSIY